MYIRSLFASVVAFSIAASPASASVAVPIPYSAYDGWNAIRTPRLSDDGRYLAYQLAPEDGDGVLVVRDIDRKTERRADRGSAPAFAAGGRFVVFTLLPRKADVDAAKKAKKKDDQLPKNGVGILDLSATSPPETIENIKSVAVAKYGGAVIAYRAEAPPSASPAPAASPAAAAGVSPAPSTSASPSPKKADKTKETGALLTIRDLASGTRTSVPDVTEYVVSDDDRFIAYATQSKNGHADGVSLYDVARRETVVLASGEGRYRKLAIARNGTSLAFLSDVATYAGDVPRDALYVADLSAAHPEARLAVDAATNGMPPSTAPNANGSVEISHDGARVFFGTAVAPTPLPSGTPEPMKVDQWSWNDDVLQSAQKHEAETERKRTYLAVYDRTSGRFAQLGSPAMPTVMRNENPATALGIDDRAYRRATSWLGERYEDLYGVSLAGGARRLLARRASEGSVFSPGGRFALTWDEGRRRWIALDVASGKRVVLAPQARVSFALEDDDHPMPPQPYGSGGWLADDRGVFLYDRYDVWLANPQTGAAIDLTRGIGRKTHTVYSPVQTDPDAEAFDPAKPILLALVDAQTYASGYARVDARGGVPVTLLKANETVNGFRADSGTNYHDLSRPIVAARSADRLAFSRESFRRYRDLWVTDASFRSLVQVTDANPQQAKYRWGSGRLIHYTSATGVPLQGALFVPDGLRRDRKAPMLVYFYERMSDFVNYYFTPAPGTSPNFTRYVSHGYVVLLADVRYRVGHPGASAVECLMPAVDAAIATGYVDPKRIGIAGHSWAAYQINYLITKVHRFRAAEAGAAVDDMFSAYGGIRLESGNVRESQYEHTQSRIGATPWDRPDLYLENSGLFGIKNVTTPYLTIADDLDGAVPQFQGIEYITAMRRLGKIAYLFSFDGEDHNLRGREQQKYWTVHLDEWFDYWLTGAPRPAWMNGVPYLQRGERSVHALFGEPS